MKHDAFIFPPDSKKSFLKNYDPAYHDGYHDKAESVQKLHENIQKIAAYQDILYAQNTYALLVIFQAMDAAGKDSTIKHVMSGVNPQGFQVFNFKAPSAEELDHDYLWRTSKSLPERGRIGIFNRSYYEEVLVVRVHPELFYKQQLPQTLHSNHIWKQRFEEINNFEKYLVNNGVIVLKFFLNVSKKEQKKRFLERISFPEKNWKFSVNDVRERAFWDDYMQAYEAVFQNTSTEYAPWHIIPADRKWFTRLVVADIICKKLESLNLKYPTVSTAHQQELMQAKTILEQEEEI
ncbi:polyphosphate kinase 2 family protein [Aliinostoc sp. HNIBRCY26]|uniref:polyphosphate kinase 2 family protein n=1 Tax=Aliinostoc sp. HNIBRCY26 TaxID=3418997 RepID=UPI003D072D21